MPPLEEPGRRGAAVAAPPPAGMGTGLDFLGPEAERGRCCACWGEGCRAGDVDGEAGAVAAGALGRWDAGGLGRLPGGDGEPLLPVVVAGASVLGALGGAAVSAELRLACNGTQGGGPRGPGWCGVGAHGHGMERTCLVRR